MTRTHARRYSGPGSHYSTIAKANQAYFQMVNDQGGVNGRKITLISLDDAYSPPKTVEQTRKLIEQDDVLLIFDTLGTATNAAIQNYLNGKKVRRGWVFRSRHGKCNFLLHKKSAGRIVAHAKGFRRIQGRRR